VLLRAVFSSTLLLQAVSCLREPNPATAATVIGLVECLASCLLLIGFLTPMIAIFVALGAAGIVLSGLASCLPPIFDCRLTVVLAATMLLNILIIGPGAYSVDAKLFGRREVIIPRVRP
jgi:uncharacterized membrane protein YphA (DoxX/SURF4 family)